MARIMYAQLCSPDPDRPMKGEAPGDWHTVEKREIGIGEVAAISGELNKKAQRATLGDGSVIYIELNPVGHAPATPVMKVTTIHHIWVSPFPGERP